MQHWQVKRACFWVKVYSFNTTIFLSFVFCRDKGSSTEKHRIWNLWRSPINLTLIRVWRNQKFYRMKPHVGQQGSALGKCLPDMDSLSSGGDQPWQGWSTVTGADQPWRWFILKPITRPRWAYTEQKNVELLIVYICCRLFFKINIVERKRKNIWLR